MNVAKISSNPVLDLEGVGADAVVVVVSSILKNEKSSLGLAGAGAGVGAESSKKFPSAGAWVAGRDGWVGVDSKKSSSGAGD